MRHCLHNLLAIAIAAATLSAARPAQAQDDASRRLDALEEAAEHAVSQRRWLQAAHAYREVAAARPTPSVKLREMFAWLRADSCEEATRASSELLSMQTSRGAATEAAREVQVVCHLRAAEAAVDAGDLGAAERALGAARAYIELAEARERLDAVAAIVRRRRQLIDATPRRSPLLDETPVESSSWTLEGVDADVAASALLYDLVSTDTEDDRLRRPEDEPTRPRQIKDARRRINARHWLIPSVYSATRAVRTGFILMVMEDPGAKKGHDVEARLVPQWASGSLGAKLRIAF
jgi:hypothetical protein